jgi:hypothetical protein
MPKDGIITDFAQLRSPAHEEWRELRSMAASIPTWDLWSGCIGLAVYPVDPQNLTVLDKPDAGVLIPAEELTWMAMVDLPPGRWNEKPVKPVRFVTTAKAKLHCRVPRIDFTQPELKWNHWRIPFDTIRRGKRIMQAGTHSPDALNSRKHEREFYIANRCLRAMLTQARTFRKSWKKAYQDTPGVYYGADGTVADKKVRCEDAMPRPYYQLHEDVRGYDLLKATMVTVDGAELLCPGVIEHFIRDLADGLEVRSPVSGVYQGITQETKTETMHLIHGDEEAYTVRLMKKHGSLHVKPGDKVRKGDAIGFAARQLPDVWKKLRSPFARYGRLSNYGIGPKVLRHHLINWFDRKIITVDSKSFIDAELAITACTNPKAEGFITGLWFDTVRDLDCLNEHDKVWAYIPPAMRQRNWNDWRFSCGALELDCRPYDPRLMEK